MYKVGYVRKSRENVVKILWIINLAVPGFKLALILTTVPLWQDMETVALVGSAIQLLVQVHLLHLQK